MAETALATTKPKSHRKPTKRLTATEIGLMLRLREDGLTQTAIAQRLDCDQAAVNRWLVKLTDTTDVAKSFLRGQALPMAEKIVKKGRPSDLVKTLQGISVLEDDQKSGLVVNVGGNAIVNFGPLSPMVTRELDVKSTG